MLLDLAAQTLLDSMRRQRSIMRSLTAVAACSATACSSHCRARSGGIGVTMAALDKCYEIDHPRAFYKRRPMAFGLTAAAAALVGVVAPAAAGRGGVRDWVVQYRMPTVSAWAIGTFDLIRGSLAIAAALAFVSLLYHFGPCVKRRCPGSCTPGSAFTLVCWVVIGLAFRATSPHFGEDYHKTYGPVGGVAVLLLLFYLDALILLIGAEINSEIDYAALKVKRRPPTSAPPSRQPSAPPTTRPARNRNPTDRPRRRLGTTRTALTRRRASCKSRWPMRSWMGSVRTCFAGRLCGNVWIPGTAAKAVSVSVDWLNCKRTAAQHRRHGRTKAYGSGQEKSTLGYGIYLR